MLGLTAMFMLLLVPKWVNIIGIALMAVDGCRALLSIEKPG
jgi:hypothetical protein